MKTQFEDPNLKRLQMRAWRRGTREMDMILGPWADAHLAGLSAEDLDLLEALMTENDQDLYQWISKGEGGPEAFQGLFAQMGAFARERHGT